MEGFRGAGVLGATVIIAGGVAYLFWRHTGKKPKSRLETERGGDEAEERQAERLSAAAAAAPPVIEVTPAPKASQVQDFHTHSPTFCSRRRMWQRKKSELALTRPSVMFYYTLLSLTCHTCKVHTFKKGVLHLHEFAL